MDKFLVTAATGNTSIAGALTVDDTLKVKNSGVTLFTIDGATGSVSSSSGAAFDGAVSASSLSTTTNVTISGTPSATTDAATVGYVRTKAIGEWSIKTAAYTAVKDDFIWANTSGGAFTVTLPSAPVVNDRITIGDVAGTWATNKLTLGRNDSLIMGLAEDLLLDIKNITVEVVYSGSTYGWRIV